jgi:acetyltransferase-like isoleucine patch superfamily enzyme
MRHMFLYYSYALNLLLFINNVFPPFIRTLLFKLVFGKIGKNVFIDYGVYFRFPKNIEISDDVRISGGAKFLPSFHNRNSKIEIHNNVRIVPDLLLGAGHDHRYLSLPVILERVSQFNKTYGEGQEVLYSKV